uniref:Uncharacterized protein n=1 Tax=Anguilla anguilla TaxID=7936 RepID=A0A0E9WL13_ANGAN
MLHKLYSMRFCITQYRPVSLCNSRKFMNIRCFLLQCKQSSVKWV